MRSVPGSGWLYAAGVLAQTALDAETILREGACVLMLRHAQTEAGVGNPPNFNLAQCSTQRNLSEAGRAQSRQIGQWLSSRRLRPRRVTSSPWCRCQETADLAFGRHTVAPALASTFDDSSTQASQQGATRSAGCGSRWTIRRLGDASGRHHGAHGRGTGDKRGHASRPRRQGAAANPPGLNHV